MYHRVTHFFIDHLSDYRLKDILQRSSCERTKRGSGLSDNAECPVFQNCVSNRTVQPTRYNVSQFIYFCKTLYRFQTVFSVQHRELKTAHTASGICQTNT